jgi:hypothetical protein
MSRMHEVDGLSVLREVATDLFESLSTPISLSCEIMLRYGDIPQLVGKNVSPVDYLDHLRFRDDYQAVNFLRKVPFVMEGLDPRATAKEKFLAAELECKSTNARIRAFLEDPAKTASSVVRQAFCLSGAKIQEIIGTTVPVREWFFGCRFGPGSFNHPDARGLTSVYDKLQVNPSVSNDFRDMGAILVKSSPSWCRSLTGIEDELDAPPYFRGGWPFFDETSLVSVPGNRVTFVPKTAITERAIAIEPLLNVFAQLGLGRVLRRRLLRNAQTDLDDQTLNQRLAKMGSVDGSLATIDLSSASDTVSREVVRALLPDAWFSALNICRSKVGELDGVSFAYEKFSSMGNGFTFELETLIFYALAHSACVIVGADPDWVSVYGDDIVVPIDAYETLREILTFFGFTLNSKKSFNTGKFRESCGKDYYGGQDVRPFLQTEVPSEVRHLFTLANGLRRLAYRRNRGLGCDDRLWPAWRACLRAIPKALRTHLKVPAHAGDSDGLISNWDEAQESAFVVPHRGGWEGYKGLRLCASPHGDREVSNFLGGAATLLYRARNGFEDNSVPSSPRRGRDVVFRVNRAFYGPWTELGGWA